MSITFHFCVSKVLNSLSDVVVFHGRWVFYNQSFCSSSVMKGTQRNVVECCVDFIIYGKIYCGFSYTIISSLLCSLLEKGPKNYHRSSVVAA